MNSSLTLSFTSFLQFDLTSILSQQMRGPHDVINLGSLFGMNSERSRQAVCDASEAAVAHGDVRKSTHKGILRELDGVSIPFPEKANMAL